MGLTLHPRCDVFNLSIINKLMAERVGFEPCEVPPINSLRGFRTAESSRNAQNQPSWNDPGTVNHLLNGFRTCSPTGQSARSAAAQSTAVAVLRHEMKRVMAMAPTDTTRLEVIEQDGRTTCVTSEHRDERGQQRRIHHVHRTERDRLCAGQERRPRGHRPSRSTDRERFDYVEQIRLGPNNITCDETESSFVSQGATHLAHPTGAKVSGDPIRADGHARLEHHL